MIGIDVLGLDKQDRGYLDTLIRVFAGGPAAVPGSERLPVNSGGWWREGVVGPLLD